MTKFATASRPTAIRASRAWRCRRARSTRMFTCSSRATALSPARGYTPPDSTLADLKHLHATLGIDRVVFTQPSVYGTDNSAILNGMAALNRATPDRARSVVASTCRSGQGARALDESRRARRAAEHRQQGRHADRARPDPGAGSAHPAVEMAPRVPVPRQGHRRADAGFQALKVPMSIAHFAYQPATAGVSAPGLPGASRADESAVTPG